MHTSGSETAEGFEKSKDCLAASWPLVACIPRDSWGSSLTGVLCSGLSKKSIGVVCDVSCLVSERIYLIRSACIATWLKHATTTVLAIDSEFRIFVRRAMTETPKTKKAMDTKWKDSKVSQTGVKNKAVLTESELHEKTRRAIVESCKWIDMECACKHVVEGKTLWDRILEMKRRKYVLGEKSLRIGSTFYAQMRELYESSDGLDRLLVPPDSVEESKGLIPAMVSAMKHPPHRAAIRTWVEQAARMNEADCVAVSKILIRLNPVHADQRQTGLAIVRALTRCKAWETHPELKKTLFGKIDTLLTQVVGV
eukprot:1835478-Amphidinium_carterae.2